MTSVRYLVHLVNPVSGWVVTQVHAVAKTEEAAISKALHSFGINQDDLSQTLKAIPQVIGEVADDEGEEAVKEVEAAPVPVTEPEVASQAELIAAKMAATLPADVIAAIAALSKSKE